MTTHERVALIRAALSGLTRPVAFADADDPTTYVRFARVGPLAPAHLLMEVAARHGNQQDEPDLTAIELLGQMGLLRAPGENFQREVAAFPEVLADQVEWIFEAVLRRPVGFDLIVSAA